MVGRVYAYLVIAVILAATIYPITWPLSRDSFPLSNYPMFSRPLPEPTVVVPYAVGVERDGTRYHIPPELVANAEVLQARAVLRTALIRGQATTDALCRRIAERVAKSDNPDWARVIEIRVVIGTHDAVAYLTGTDTEGSEDIHGFCPVERAP